MARRAAEVWVPLEDLRAALNALPGEPLTQIDVEQRLYTIRHEHGGYGGGLDEELKAAALAAYADEKANGTKFIAILGWLEEWTWGAEENLRRKRNQERQEQIKREKRNAEARLRSGSDCPWTPATGLADLHCRRTLGCFA